MVADRPAARAPGRNAEQLRVQDASLDHVQIPEAIFQQLRVEPFRLLHDDDGVLGVASDPEPRPDVDHRLP
eukprot:548427-Pyramimonas_sp.AAC.1